MKNEGWKMKDEGHVSPDPIGFKGIWEYCERLKDIWKNFQFTE